jgi:hypothetical protein
MKDTDPIPCCHPSDPPGLPPCVAKRKGLTAEQWASLLDDDTEIRASRDRAWRIISKNLINQAYGADPWAVPPEFASKPYGNFLARGVWLLMKIIPDRDLTWEKMEDGSPSPGEDALVAIGQAARAGDWEFVKRLAEIQIAIAKRKRLPDVTNCGEPRDIILARNWVRFHDVDSNLPGLAWFRKANANGDSGNGIEIINALLKFWGVPMFTRARLEKRTTELQLRPIRSHALAKLPTATWATQIIHALKK